MTGNSNALMAEVAPISAANANSSYAIRRRVVLAATIGNTLEWYDFLVYGFLSVTIGKLFFPSGSELTHFAAPLDRDVWCWRRHAAGRRRRAL